jgi:hypothetical protein
MVSQRVEKVTGGVSHPRSSIGIGARVVLVVESTVGGTVEVVDIVPAEVLHAAADRMRKTRSRRIEDHYAIAYGLASVL